MNNYIVYEIGDSMDNVAINNCVIALRNCPDPHYECSDCPVNIPEKSCQNELVAADIIESLCEQLKDANARLEAVTKERDAAVYDMENLQGMICLACKEYDPSCGWSCRVNGNILQEIAASETLLACGSFKWRGVQKDGKNGSQT